MTSGWISTDGKVVGEETGVREMTSETIDVCEVCGSTNLQQIKCKVVCRNCGTILRSCSDLAQ